MPQDRTPTPAAAIPRPKDGDVEDVSWALSTAEAMWGRGDRADALKWVRRAAEAASEADKDDRALEIAKAAADLAQLIERGGGSMPPPAQAQSAAPGTHGSGGAAPRTSAPKINRNVMVQPIAPTPLRASSPTPQVSRGSHSEIARRPRKSAHTIEEPLPKTASDARKSQPGAGAPRRQGSTTNETPRKRRSTIPPAAREDPSETTNVSPPKPPSAPPPSGRGTEPHTTDEMEQWPTQALEGDALSGLAEEMTRVGTPAFTDEEHPASPRRSPSVRPPASVRPSASEPPGHPDGHPQGTGARPSQAMRVVVWRAADGVHVAPHGTTVSAITVDALLVALDPSADLASWLAKK